MFLEDTNEREKWPGRWKIRWRTERISPHEQLPTLVICSSSGRWGRKRWLRSDSMVWFDWIEGEERKNMSNLSGSLGLTWKTLALWLGRNSTAGAPWKKGQGIGLEDGLRNLCWRGLEGDLKWSQIVVWTTQESEPLLDSERRKGGWPSNLEGQRSDLKWYNGETNVLITGRKTQVQSLRDILVYVSLTKGW